MYVLTIPCDEGIVAIPIERVAFVGLTAATNKITLDLVMPNVTITVTVADPTRARESVDVIIDALGRHRGLYSETYRPG